ncbi:response regulator transcription factor [Ilumatobacter nonamiensis]|uniref:response regulator transcription factor n=1 Tax=Ilumatobacter nonamiensis TaxID=467093 RepID=UPI000349945B|nr:response regulator transcription factor [Ilumatobacter nonamiensis]
MSRAENSPLRVSIVNDYEVVVHGLAAMLSPFSERVVVVEVEAGGLPDASADIVLFDTFASRRRSLERVAEIGDMGSVGKVVLYTWDLPATFAAAVETAAVDGVIMKSASGEELVEALERVHRGDPVGVDPTNPADVGPTLTEREREVLALLARGATNREIADELYLSVDTIKTHVRKVFTKLAVSNRTQAALAAGRLGLQPKT